MRKLLFVLTVIAVATVMGGEIVSAKSFDKAKFSKNNLNVFRYYKEIEKSRPPYPIVNGSETDYKEWKGAIAVVGEGPDGQMSMCTGTLIDPEVVLTAGHCVYRKSKQGQLETINVKNIQAGANLVEAHLVANVKEVKMHPQWNGDVQQGVDLALIHLEEKVIDIDFYGIRSTSPQQGETGVIVGYGLTSVQDQQSTGVHRKGDSSIQSVQQYGIIEIGNPSGTCQGDSGGPFFTLDGNSGKYLVTGVTSYGNPQYCSATSGGYDVSVSSYAEWIKQTVNEFTGHDPVTPPGGETCQTPDQCSEGFICDSGKCVREVIEYSCPDTYKCLGSCSETMQECEKDIAKESKDMFVAIRECIDTNCANSQNMEQCVQYYCSQQETACNNDDGCQAYIACMSDAGLCEGTCVYKADDNAESSLENLMKCYNDNCGDAASQEEFNKCSDEECGDQFDACFVPGDFTCKSIMQCMGNCADGDGECQNDCYLEGSKEGRTDADSMFACFEQNCSNLNQAEFNECAETKCKSELETCYEIVIPDNDPEDDDDTVVVVDEDSTMDHDEDEHDVTDSGNEKSDNDNSTSVQDSSDKTIGELKADEDSGEAGNDSQPGGFLTDSDSGKKDSGCSCSTIGL